MATIQRGTGVDRPTVTTQLIGIIVANRVFQGLFFGGVARFPGSKR